MSFDRFKRRQDVLKLPKIVIKRPKGISNISFELLNLYAVKLDRVNEKLRTERKEDDER